MPDLKGWRVVVSDICQCYVRAESPAQAKKVAQREEPSGTVDEELDWWIKLRVKRAPEFDERLSEALMQQVGYLATEEFGKPWFGSDDDTSCVCVYSD